MTKGESLLMGIAMNIFWKCEYDRVLGGEPPLVQVELARELRNEDTGVIYEVILEVIRQIEVQLGRCLDGDRARVDPLDLVAGAPPAAPARKILALPLDDVFAAVPEHLRCTVNGILHVWWQPDPREDGEWCRVLSIRIGCK